jgi:biotin carboxyl carrier protein
MEMLNIRSIARHQQLVKVDPVEISDGHSRVRIRVSASESGGASLVHAVTAAGASIDTAPTATVDGTSMVVKSEGLGRFRRGHPARAEEAVRPGDVVSEGQPLALLQMGDVYSSVNSPVAGTVESVMVKDGQRIDYGMPPFRLKQEGH